MNILIIDDAPDIRKLLEQILQKAGYDQLEFATSGQEAVAIVEEKEKDLDLILLDVVLPDSNGIEICKEFKQRPNLEEVPIIMVTGKEDNDTLERAFAAGAMDYIVKPLSPIELRARVTSALRLREEIKTRNQREAELKKTAKKLERVNRKLERMASLDGLTGLANRRLFDESLVREWKKTRRHGEYLTLLMLDIDYFKNYNDAYGHQAGDSCLKKLANQLKKLVTRPGDIVARYGGEEFAVILPNTDQKGAKEVATRIRAGVEKLELEHKESPISSYVTVSVGAAVTKPEKKSVATELLLETADQALYQAKEAGRNQVVIKDQLLNWREKNESATSFC